MTALQTRPGDPDAPGPANTSVEGTLHVACGEEMHMLKFNAPAVNDAIADVRKASFGSVNCAGLYRSWGVETCLAV